MTFTIAVSIPEHGLLGIATASKALAVGAGVPELRPGVGVVATQAYTNRALRRYALDSLERGLSPEFIVRSLSQVDPHPERRQLTVIDAQGRSATHTGSECSSHAESIQRGHTVAVGNLVAGAPVLTDMLDAFYATPAPTTQDMLARRLLRCLSAGDAAGGDVRGRQSAALMVTEHRLSGVIAPSDSIDLRVDDHEDPLAELGRLYELFALEAAR